MINPEKKENRKNDIVKKKQWKKPVIITITKEELSKHIRAAARSGGCMGNMR